VFDGFSMVFQNSRPIVCDGQRPHPPIFSPYIYWGPVKNYLQKHSLHVIISNTLDIAKVTKNLSKKQTSTWAASSDWSTHLKYFNKRPLKCYWCSFDYIYKKSKILAKLYYTSFWDKFKMIPIYFGIHPKT